MDNELAKNKTENDVLVTFYDSSNLYGHILTKMPNLHKYFFDIHFRNNWTEFIKLTILNNI